MGTALERVVEVGHRHLPRTHLPQGRFLHEAPPGPSGHERCAVHAPSLGTARSSAARSRTGLSRRKAKGKRGTNSGKPVAARDLPTKCPRQGPTQYENGHDPVVRSEVAEGAALYTDEARLLGDFAHEAVGLRIRAHTNGLESFGPYHGTYHHLSAKHLQRYIDEFATRHGIREPTRWRKWRRPRGASSGGGSPTRN